MASINEEEDEDDELLKIVAKLPLSQTQQHSDDIDEDDDHLLEMVGKMVFSQTQEMGGSDRTVSKHAIESTVGPSIGAERGGEGLRASSRRIPKESMNNSATPMPPERTKQAEAIKLSKVSVMDTDHDTRKQRDDLPVHPDVEDVDLSMSKGPDSEEEMNIEEPSSVENTAVDSILPVRRLDLPRREAIHITGSFMTVTASNGERVYAPVSEASGPYSSVDIAGSLRRSRGGLLSRSIDHLMAEVEKEQFERILAETAAEAGSNMETTAGREMQTANEASVASDVAADGDNIQTLKERKTSKRRKAEKPTTRRKKKKIEDTAGMGRRGKAMSGASSLWVDKYAPKTFLDLLSDEMVNRDVVRWLKSWDPCVFNRPATTGPASRSGKVSGSYSTREHLKRQRDGLKGTKEQTSDLLGRPEHKAILLCGAPGLGKTTLAHVVAAHCGYRPVEINASDDRSSSTLLKRVIDVVETTASVSGDKRPNCLIIDEIDGAAGGAESRNAILALVKVITAAPIRSSKQGGNTQSHAAGEAHEGISLDDEHGGSDDDDDSENVDRRERAVGWLGGSKSASNRSFKPSSQTKTSQTGKKRLKPLMRPIICICNDLYAPALRPLREVAKVFHFRRPSAERLAHRLDSICAMEGLRVEKSTLRMLAERSECDMRSCINTLQFLSKRQQVVRHVDIAKLGLGQKDQTKGAFQIWTELLQQKKSNGSVFPGIAENKSQRCERLYDSLLDFGESDLVLMGLQESLPSLKFFDMALSRTSQVLESFQDADILLRSSHHSGGPSLMISRYVPAAILAATHLVSSHERPFVTWPRSFGEVKRRHGSNKAILQQWMLGMSPLTYAAWGHAAASQEVLPMLPHIMSPTLRPVSWHLFTDKESAAATSLIDSLLNLGLTYSLRIDENENRDENEDMVFGAARAAGNLIQHIFPRKTDVGRTLHLNGHGGHEPDLEFKPPIHRLWKFRGSVNAENNAKKALPIATRQTLVHETAMEAIRRSNKARHAGQHEPGPFPQSHESRVSENEIRPFQGSHVPLDLAQRLQQAGVTAKSGTAAAAASLSCKKLNWLDTLRANRHAHRSGKHGTREQDRGNYRGDVAEQSVLYKFHEGYTNAVKRPVLVYELL